MHLIERLRLMMIGLIAISVSLPMAWVSLGKLLLFVSCLLVLGAGLRHKEGDRALAGLWSVRVILGIVAAFALSLTWSQAPLDLALQAFGKHSKLLEIAMLIGLIRRERDARLAVVSFLLGQTLFILSSWTMAAGVVVPWATSEWATIPQFRTVVYSTYLDQSLIFSASAAVFWHLRSYWPAWRWAAALMAAAALINTLFLQEGRTGYVAALAVLTLAIMWELPKKLRLAALVLIPLVLLAGLYAGSAQVKARLTQAFSESQSYGAQGASASSSGFRLHAWRRSLQAMQESPLSGHGVGSWTSTVKRIQGADADKVFGNNPASNPHQEYLLWGVELGLGGSLLLLLLILALLRDASGMAAPVKRASYSVIAVMALACLFNSSLYDALIGDFFCISLGLLLALGVRQHGAHHPSTAATAYPNTGAMA
ncbi:O-antigen ligase family protein [Rhodoferax sp.]|uniref:O-antigen ligase family protein n=1 Tax=Rhodoferax sp. TaxID=50421 RepID=UPI00260D68C7|nr:O-antigen ligase family protein [Rhodoferax sp.]MDD2926177.1 O-antigen ligase family protein [Rhodoferax sp.]